MATSRPCTQRQNLLSVYFRSNTVFHESYHMSSTQNSEALLFIPTTIGWVGLGWFLKSRLCQSLGKCRYFRSKVTIRAHKLN